jgi:hypothetical protein
MSTESKNPMTYDEQQRLEGRLRHTRIIGDQLRNEVDTLTTHTLPRLKADLAVTKKNIATLEGLLNDAETLPADVPSRFKEDRFGAVGYRQVGCTHSAVVPLLRGALDESEKRRKELGAKLTAAQKSIVTKRDQLQQTEQDVKTIRATLAEAGVRDAA